METEILTALMIASGKLALSQVGATSNESTLIVNSMPQANLAMDIQMWHNPEEWAKYTLMMHRLHGTTTYGAEDAEPQEPRGG